MGTGAEGLRTASVESVGAWLLVWLSAVVGAMMDDDVK